METNYSVSGERAQSLSLKSKIGLAIVALGIGVLLYGFKLDFAEIPPVFNGYKAVGILTILLGAGAFSFRKWYYSLGAILFAGGLMTLYYGYTQTTNEEKYLWSMIAFGIMFAGSVIFTFDPQKRNYLFSLHGKMSTPLQKIGMAISLIGLSIILLSWLAFYFAPEEGEKGSSFYYFLAQFSQRPALFGTLSILSMIGGILLYTIGIYRGHPKGIKNHFVQFNSLSGRGAIGWIVGIILTIFYIQLYYYNAPLEKAIRLFDPISQLFRGKPADNWFMYGTLYTVIILALGIKFIIKYRHNRYQLIRTIVVILSQLILAYFIPNIMEALNYDSATAVVDGKSKYLGYYSANPINSWPLNKDAFAESTFKAYTETSYQPWGMAYLFWGILLFLVVTPVVTYYVGKRWYCSWFCGCGGLAETAGDSFRHLSNKTVKAWKIERWVIHSVMVFVIMHTIASLFPYLTGKEYVLWFGTLNKDTYFYFVASLLIIGAAGLLYLRIKKFKQNNLLIVGIAAFAFLFTGLTYAYLNGTEDAFLIDSKSIKSSYGFFVGFAFSGVIGVGFYPILGNRVWCRFGCPMAGYMGIFQRFKSKFRITTNGAQCISCGNCSTYCEQGIDVRAYAQKGENIVRASCVGCGICSAVCPRGVLKLENGPEDGRFEPNPLIISKDGVKLNL